MLKKLWLALWVATLAFPTLAQENFIKKSIEEKFNTSVTSVKPSGYLGLYEVYLGGQILYTDAKVKGIIIGSLIDAKTMQNVTENRMAALNRVNFSDLPLKQAFKQVRGDGKRTLVTFEDPNCGYCKRLAKDIAQLSDVTIYTFLLPILSEDSFKKSIQIWCSADQAATWNDWMLNNKAPSSGKENCDSSVLDKNRELARQLNINGTPVIFFADGSRIPGAAPLATIEQKMNSIK